MPPVVLILKQGDLALLKQKPVLHKHPKHYFSDFLADPMIASSFVVVALVTLILAIIEFSKAVGY